jgi:tetratricopeptide (TPR) repeat protein
VLSVAAVTGREFDLDVLAAVGRQDPDETLDLLDEAVDSQVIEEERASGRYRFTHALVRETLAGSLSRARQARLHAAIAEVLEPRLEHDPEFVAEVAHHFVQGAAVRPELGPRAVRHAITAARLAENRGALDEALLHWEQALAADTLADRPDQRRRYDVLLGLGMARQRRGQIDSSREALDAAVDLGRQLGDIELIAQAATSFRGAGVWHWREFGTSDPAMVAVLEECLAALPVGELHARVLASLAMELTYQWRSAEALTLGRRAVEIARDLHDPALLSDIVAMHTMALWGKPGAAAESIALREEVLANELTLETELNTRFGGAASHIQRGDTVEADRWMARCIEIARRLRHTGADVPIAWWRFYRAIDRGDQALAERLGEEAVTRHRRSQIVSAPAMFVMQRIRLGGPGTELTDDEIEIARDNASAGFRGFAAHALTECGRVDLALDILGEPTRDGAWDYSSTVGDCYRVDVLAHAGPSDELRRALARIEPWAGEFAIYGSTECVGCIDYFIGRGRHGLGELDAAAAAYRRAAELNRAARIVPWQRRAEQWLADLDAGEQVGRYAAG